MLRFGLALLTVGLATGSFASGKEVFQKLKGLEGSWAGMAAAGDETFEAKVTYKITGGGSAVVETQFPGQAHEMVTIYHLDGDDLVLTHYCAAQNQPHMKLVSEKNGLLKFDFVSAGKMNPKAPHMHSMQMELLDKDHVKSAWQFYADGKITKGHLAKFDMRRVK